MTDITNQDPTEQDPTDKEILEAAMKRLDEKVLADAESERYLLTAIDGAHVVVPGKTWIDDVIEHVMKVLNDRHRHRVYASGYYQELLDEAWVRLNKMGFLPCGCKGSRSLVGSTREVSGD